MLCWSFCTTTGRVPIVGRTLIVRDVIRRGKERHGSYPLGGEGRLCREILREHAKRKRIPHTAFPYGDCHDTESVRGLGTHGHFSTLRTKESCGGIMQASDMLGLDLWTAAPCLSDWPVPVANPYTRGLLFGTGCGRT